MRFTLEHIKNLKVGDTVFLKHNSYYSFSSSETVTVKKIGKKYIELDDTPHKIVIATGELTKDYRGYAPDMYTSEHDYNVMVAKHKFTLAVRKYCADLDFAEAKAVKELLNLDIKLDEEND